MIKVVKSINASLPKELAILAAYAHHERPAAHLPLLLKELNSHGINVIIGLNCENIDSLLLNHEIIEIAALSRALILKNNEGFDFYMWKCILELYPECWNCERLYMINDSIIGPLFSMKSLIENIRARDCDYIGLTFNWAHIPHFQSYFTVYNVRALRSSLIRDFWSSILIKTHKWDVITNYELNVLTMVQRAGLRSQVLFWGPCDNDMIYCDSTIYRWRQLIDDGFPFIKGSLIRKENRIIDTLIDMGISSNVISILKVESEKGQR